MQACSNFFQQHGIKDKRNLTIDVLRANNLNLFFYINIYFSNRFLIQLIMENIPTLKCKIIGWCEESQTTSVSSLGEIIKMQMNHC